MWLIEPSCFLSLVRPLWLELPYMPRPYYITCAGCTWLDSKVISTKSSKAAIHENIDIRKFSTVQVKALCSHAVICHTSPLSLRCWTSTILPTTTSPSLTPASSCWRFHATLASQFLRRSCAMPSTSANQLTLMTMLEWTYRYIDIVMRYWCLENVYHPGYTVLGKDGDLLPIKPLSWLW